MTDSKLEELHAKLGELSDVNSALAMLSWDQEVFMPPKAGPGRGQQLATLSAVAHRMLTTPEMGDLLRELKDASDSLDENGAKLVDETLYDYQRATRLPEAFVQTFAEETSKAYEVWVKAREAADFALFQPNLERMLELLKQKADLMGYEGSPYNALLEEYERGMTAEQLKPLFAELAEKQSALVERIMQAPKQPDVEWLDQQWPEEAQWAFTMEVLEDLGFDFEAGRQDKSIHPFTTNFDIYDVRLTTRLDPADPFQGLGSSIHECGHGLYEQGYRPEDRRTPLAQAPSLGMHESQSRMWENMIGRSLPFWTRYAPIMRRHFPGQLDGHSTEAIYRTMNRVQPSFIRVEADECTYNLHIILRFEMETALMEGALKVAEIPEMWNSKIKDYLGLDVPDDATGCLQDIHWSHGCIGYFPTYALGNLYAAQLFERICLDVPNLWEQAEIGNFGGLLEWLREHVHKVGRRKTASEIVCAATGSPPGAEAYLRYLESKYGALYGL